MNAALAPNSVGRAELVFALGAGLILVSGLFPWIAATEAIPVADPSEQAEGLNSFGGDSTSDEILGVDRVDWVVLAGVGLVATALVVTEPWTRVVLAIAGASAVAAVGLAVVYLVDPAWMYSDWIKSEVAAVASAGPGVYLALGGGLCQCGGWYLGYSGTGSTAGAQRLDAPAQGGVGSSRGPQQRGPPQQDQPDSRQRHQQGRREPRGQQPPNRQQQQQQSNRQGGPPEQSGQQPPAESNQPRPNSQSPPTTNSREQTDSERPAEQGDESTTGGEESTKGAADNTDQ